MTDTVYWHFSKKCMLIHDIEKENLLIISKRDAERLADQIKEWIASDCNTKGKAVQ